MLTFHKRVNDQRTRSTTSCVVLSPKPPAAALAALVRWSSVAPHPTCNSAPWRGAPISTVNTHFEDAQVEVERGRGARPCPAVYSQRSTRQIFDKLAHSSIMRLSESSMDKLYDLMTMVRLCRLKPAEPELKARWSYKCWRPPTHHYLLILVSGEGPLCTIQRLQPICDTLLSSVAFNFNLRRYTMGFKYQLVSCRAPQEVLTVTLTHLVTVKSYLTDPNVIALVTSAEDQLRKHFAAFNLGEW